VLIALLAALIVGACSSSTSSSSPTASGTIAVQTDSPTGEEPTGDQTAEPSGSDGGGNGNGDGVGSFFPTEVGGVTLVARDQDPRDALGTKQTARRLLRQLGTSYAEISTADARATSADGDRVRLVGLQVPGAPPAKLLREYLRFLGAGNRGKKMNVGGKQVTRIPGPNQGGKKTFRYVYARRDAVFQVQTGSRPLATQILRELP